MHDLWLLVSIPIGIVLIMIFESDLVRFGRPSTSTCNECHQLRRVVQWHNGKTACLPCIHEWENLAP